MKNEKFLLFILATIQFTHIIDFMIIMPLGKQLMEDLAITPQQFSFIVTAYAWSAAVTGMFGAMFIDRFDRKKVLIFLYVGFTIGTFACAIAPSYFLFLAARSFAGAFGGILAAIILAIIGDAIPFERRAHATGIVMMAFSAASVVGVPAGLWIAAELGWRMTFVVIGGVSVLFIFFSLMVLPSLAAHLENQKKSKNPFQAYLNILNDNNQLQALFFGMMVILGHFTIIPFIAPYMQLNIGFSNEEITYIYLVGGLLTVIVLPLVGKLADRFGNPRVFMWSSLFALGSIYLITNLEPVSIVIALCVTSSYFVASSGRNVPAVTIVTSVVEPEHRGSFMSVRTSVNQFAMGASSFIAGVIVIENSDGTLGNYEIAGYVAIVLSIVAVWGVYRLRVVS